MIAANKRGMRGDGKLMMLTPRRIYPHCEKWDNSVICHGQKSLHPDVIT
jgi:hypothetical protein